MEKKLCRPFSLRIRTEREARNREVQVPEQSKREGDRKLAISVAEEARDLVIEELDRVTYRFQDALEGRVEFLNKDDEIFFYETLRDEINGLREQYESAMRWRDASLRKIEMEELIARLVAVSRRQHRNGKSDTVIKPPIGKRLRRGLPGEYVEYVLTADDIENLRLVHEAEISERTEFFITEEGIFALERTVH